MNKEARRPSVEMHWPHLLPYITGRIDQELLLRNEYLAAENRIQRAKIKGRLQLSDGEKSTLAKTARRLGRNALAEVAVVATPDTILCWFRKLVARKFGGEVLRVSLSGEPERSNRTDDHQNREHPNPGLPD
jgi:hypothetical protein